MGEDSNASFVNGENVNVRSKREKKTSKLWWPSSLPALIDARSLHGTEYFLPATNALHSLLASCTLSICRDYFMPEECKCDVGLRRARCGLEKGKGADEDSTVLCRRPRGPCRVRRVTSQVLHSAYNFKERNRQMSLPTGTLYTTCISPSQAYQLSLTSKAKLHHYQTRRVSSSPQPSKPEIVFCFKLVSFGFQKSVSTTVDCLGPECSTLLYFAQEVFFRTVHRHA